MHNFTGSRNGYWSPGTKSEKLRETKNKKSNDRDSSNGSNLQKFEKPDESDAQQNKTGEKIFFWFKNEKLFINLFLFSQQNFIFLIDSTLNKFKTFVRNKKLPVLCSRNCQK